MGKMIFYLSLLIFLDITLISVGLLNDANSISSIILSAITNIGDVKFTTWFSQIIGDFENLFNSGAGMAAIIAAASAAALGSIFLPTDTKLFVPVGISLSLLSSDFVAFYLIMNAQAPVLSKFVMVPIIMIFIFVSLEWVRGKD